MKKKAIKIQPGIDKLEGKTGFYTRLKLMELKFKTSL